MIIARTFIVATVSPDAGNIVYRPEISHVACASRASLSEVARDGMVERGIRRLQLLDLSLLIADDLECSGYRQQIRQRVRKTLANPVEFRLARRIFEWQHHHRSVAGARVIHTPARTSSIMMKLLRKKP